MRRGEVRSHWQLRSLPERFLHPEGLPQEVGQGDAGMREEQRQQLIEALKALESIKKKLQDLLK